MSQSATIYRITPDTFQKAKSDPENFVPYESCLDYEIFGSTHEGLKYILARSHNGSHAALTDQIFYPSSQLGEIDFDNEHLDVEDFERIICYLSPHEVAAINAILKDLGETFFKKNFLPQAMNEQGVYPQVWGEGALNYEAAFRDFTRLQSIFKRGAAEGSYLLPYVG